MGDVAYYERRAREERERAAEAANPEASAIHLTLANKFAELAEIERQAERQRKPDESRAAE